MTNTPYNTMNHRRDVAREIARRYCRLEPESIEVLADLLVPMKFHRGEIVLDEGEECTCMYYVERGMVRQYYFKNKKDVTEHFSFEGRIVMCIESLLKHVPSQIIIEALETTHLYALPRKRLLDAIETCPELGILYRKVLECPYLIPAPCRFPALRECTRALRAAAERETGDCSASTHDTCCLVSANDT